VHDPGTPRGPAPLRPAPSRASTPLPGTFGLVEDPSTKEFDDGTVLLGGSPVRLFRISARARDVVRRWKGGGAVGGGRGVQLLARRLVSAGAFAPQPRTATFGPRDVTVVVPVLDRPDQLDRLLARLDGLDCIVVDDASSDATATKEICARHGARFVGLDVNAGPAGARNAGLAGVATALVAFVDSDCVPEPEWLEGLLGHFDDSLVGAVAPRIRPVHAPARAGRVIARYERVRSSLDLGARPAPVRPGSPVAYVPSAALAVRADVVSGTDLFDPRLAGGEDVDLVWRLHAAGWDVRYEPAATVGHDGASSVAAFLARRAFYGTTAGPLALRHPDTMAPAELSAWSAGVWLFALARRPLLARLTLAVSVGILARRLRGLVRHPLAVAWTIAGEGTARSAVPTLGGLTRAWSPLMAAALFPRRTRRLAVLSFLVPAVRDALGDRAGLDPVRYLALRVADDVAYGAGVWLGCARARTLRPLVPRVVWGSRVWSARALERSLASAERPSADG
jgi:mycofactocin system glycosyltransferase